MNINNYYLKKLLLILMKRKKFKFNLENELINFYEEEIKSLICENIIESEKTEKLDKNVIFDVLSREAKYFSNLLKLEDLVLLPFLLLLKL